jgi:hypothetical protein
MRHSTIATCVAAVLSLGSFAVASTVTSVGGTPYTATWSTLGTSTGSTSITTDQPRSGNGSLRLETNGGNKAAATYGGDRFGGPNLGTFGDLLDGSLGFEFYRDGSSTVAAHFAPALEIEFSNHAALKWEAVYNDYPVASPISADQWYTIDLDKDTGKFWQWNGGVVMSGSSQQNLTLAEWLNASVGNDFTTDTEITGISVQAGSGWAGSFVGYVDNVYMNFGSGTGNISANFETAAPVPTPAAAGAGFALFGVIASRRLLARRARA